MFDFDRFSMKHSEGFILQIVETWERLNNVRHFQPMLLEDRWEHFIKATNDNHAPTVATAAFN